MEKNSKKQSVIFDLGRVVIDVNVSGFNKIFSNICYDKPALAIQQIMADELMIKFNKGLITPKEFHSSICKKFTLDIPFEKFKKIWCDIFSLNPKTKSLLLKLKKNCTIGLLSNTDILHFKYLIETYPILEIFEKPTLSFELGIMKPDPQIYFKAAKNINAKIEDCIYIDDIAENVQAAIDIGMEGVIFKNIEQLQTQLESRNLI